MKTAQVFAGVAAPSVGRRRSNTLDLNKVASDVTFGTNVPRHFLVALDVLTLTLAFLVAYLLTLRVRDFALHASWFQGLVPFLSPDPSGGFRPIAEAAWVLLVSVPVVLGCMQTLGGYRPLFSQSRSRIVLTGVLSPVMGLAAIAIVLFALRTATWSRIFIFVYTGLGVALVTGHRLVLRAYHQRRLESGVYAKNVVLVGPHAAVDSIAEYLRRTTTPAQYQILGYLQVAAHGADAAPAMLSPLGTVDAFGDILVHRPIHEVIAIQGSDGGAWLRTLVETCDYFRVTLRIVPEALLFGNLKDLQLLYHADPLRLPEVVLRPGDLASDALFVKRLIDLIVSATLLVLLAPLYGLIALAIKLTTPRLPILYRWQVVGFKGRRFTGYKFTTMVEDADAQREALRARNEMQGPVFKIKNDPRVTPLGRFLRKFSLNELPQLWSVLKGDMSLVGPRPAFPHELERYELWHKRKLCVRPGMTCLWQVRGRNRISSFDDWVRMDLEYIDNWTLWLDIRILVRTAWVVIAGTGS
jgi:exopolysaccharide biosynthesis polyprenyl glycosylphosphotransferase